MYQCVVLSVSLMCKMFDVKHLPRCVFFSSSSVHGKSSKNVVSPWDHVGHSQRAHPPRTPVVL